MRIRQNRAVWFEKHVGFSRFRRVCGVGARHRLPDDVAESESAFVDGRPLAGRRRRRATRVSGKRQHCRRDNLVKRLSALPTTVTRCLLGERNYDADRFFHGSGTGRRVLHKHRMRTRLVRGICAFAPARRPVFRVCAGRDISHRKMLCDKNRPLGGGKIRVVCPKYPSRRIRVENLCRIGSGEGGRETPYCACETSVGASGDRRAEIRTNPDYPCTYSSAIQGKNERITRRWHS